MSASPLDESALRELLDRDAIRELAVRYCHCVWQRDLNVVSLFAADGRFGATRGHEALQRFYGGVFAARNTPHPFAGNHVIDFAGPDLATGTCYNDLRTDRDGHSLVIGYWRDEYMRVGGAWKFKSRDFTVVQDFRPMPRA